MYYYYYIISLFLMPLVLCKDGNYYKVQTKHLANGVNGTVKSMSFKAWQNVGPKQSNASNIIKVITNVATTIGSATICGKHCFKTPKCCGFYYKIHDYCKLVNTSRRSDTSVVEQGTDYYEILSQCTKNKTLCGNGECVPHFHNESYSCIPGPTLPGSTVPGSTVPGSTVPGLTVPGSTVPGSTVPGSTVPGSTVPGSTVPGSTVPESTVPGPTVPLDYNKEIMAVDERSAAFRVRIEDNCKTTEQKLFLLKDNGKQADNAILFASLGIQKGQVIKGAKIMFKIDNSPQNEIPYDIHIAAKNITNPSTNDVDNCNFMESLTENKVIWKGPHPIVDKMDTIETVDIKDVLQELVDMDDWDSENRVLIVLFHPDELQDDESSYYQTFVEDAVLKIAV